MIPGWGKIPWRRERPSTLVFWPREVHGLYSPWGRKESDMTKTFTIMFYFLLKLGRKNECFGQRNVLMYITSTLSLLQCSYKHNLKYYFMEEEAQVKAPRIHENWNVMLGGRAVFLIPGNVTPTVTSFLEGNLPICFQEG